MSWAGYENHATKTGFNVKAFYTFLADLTSRLGPDAVEIKQPKSVGATVDEIMVMARAKDDWVNNILEQVMHAMNGRYKRGPLKAEERVREKTKNEVGVLGRGWGECRTADTSRPCQHRPHHTVRG